MLADACRWIDMFETLCARYMCRCVESLATALRRSNDGGDVYFIGGPSGRWLAEVTSVTLQRDDANKIRLADSSRAAVRELVDLCAMRATGRSGGRGAEIVLDWFALRSGNGGPITSLSDFASSASKEREDERQCLLRIDLNNGLASVLLLANTTHVQELSTISVACNAHAERCLRPFVFILACELTVRRVTYENLSLHRDSFPPIAAAAAAASCWLSKAREMYRRTKWLRITGYDSSAAEMRDRIMCERINATGVRLSWRDGRVFRRSEEERLFAASVHSLPVSAVIDLSALPRDVRYDERSVLSLCDFDVLLRRCRDNLASNWFAAAAAAVPSVVVRDHKDDSRDRESRYYVNANNELVSRPFVQLS